MQRVIWAILFIMTAAFLKWRLWDNNLKANSLMLRSEWGNVPAAQTGAQMLSSRDPYLFLVLWYINGDVFIYCHCLYRFG